MIFRDGFTFTSESVSEGHPDKICDQISDLVLDQYLSNSPGSRVACESLITDNHLQIAGEISSPYELSPDKIEKQARELIAQIGYTHDDIGFDAGKAEVDIRLHTQSPDIAQGVTGEGIHKDEGAGDQGMMFGFAVNENEDLMPMPIHSSHKILKTLAELRHSGELPFLRPDAKSQVTVKYEGKKPRSILSVVVSSQHDPDTDHAQISEAIIESCIKRAIPAEWLSDTKYYINPTGRFVVGGPFGDCGLTGRKIIVDTYGGFARHGGGAFSGKDPSKVDRSAAYMARYIAKNLVASRAASICEIQLAYAIGVAEPVSVLINTFGTGKISDEKLEGIVKENFDLTPKGIREALSLRKIPYLPTATYGHFGRNEASFTWEQTDKTSVFQQ